MIPLVGYFSGDFIPLLFLADVNGTLDEMAQTFATHVADIRVASREAPIAVEFGGQVLSDTTATVASAGIGPMDVVYFAYASNGS